jgi:uncharacterized protein YkwD
MRRSARYAILAMIALAVVAPATVSAKSAVQREVTLEQSLLRQVNQVRVDHGLRPLALSPRLKAAASFQSRALLVQGVFDHNSAAGGSFGDRLRRFYPVGGARTWNVGENLLWGSDGIDAGSAVKLWLDSPEHRKIMLDPIWREFGIGAFATPSAPGVYASAGAVVVVTIDFGVRATQ